MMYLINYKYFKRITSSKCLCGEIILEKNKDDPKPDDPSNKL